MKTRLDFVSNSSSSSYVLALDFSKFDFGLFVRRVARNCSFSPYLKVQTKESVRGMARNEAALSYGLINVHLVFLGKLNLGKVEFVASPAALSVEKAPGFDCFKAAGLLGGPPSQFREIGERVYVHSVDDAYA